MPIYSKTNTNGLTGGDKPITVLVIAQSNLANGREGGDTSFNPDVKIWVDDVNDNAATSEFQAWDLSLAPPQHSHPAVIPDTGINIPGPNRNKWSHALAKRIQRSTRRPIRIVQAAQSALPLQHWITTANGGEQEMWDYLVTATTEAKITHYDLVFYDHGENGVGAEMGGTYEAATRLLRDQLEAAGYIDDSTTFLSREINSGTTTAAVEAVWITERNNNGRIHPNTDFVYDGDGVHLSGDEHDDVALEQSDYLFSKGKFGNFSGTVNFSEATLTALVPTGSLVILDDGGVLKKIPSAAFSLETSGLPYPATPDAVYYGENYVATSEEIVAGATTFSMDPGDTEPTVAADLAALLFPSVDSQFSSPAAILSNTGDWLVGLRVRFDSSIAQQRNLFQQYDTIAGDAAERTYFRYNTGGTLRFRCGGTAEVDFTTGDTFGINEWFTILVQRDGDTINLWVNGTLYTASGTALLVQNQPLIIGSGIMGPLRGWLRKFIVYNRAVTADEITAVTEWLDSI